MTRARLVLVTRPSGPADPLVAVLQARGYRVAPVPTVVTRPAPSGGMLDGALDDPDGWAWIVVTSATGAAIVGEAMARARDQRATLTDRDDAAARTQGGNGPQRRPRWAAVGSATAAALERSGIPVDLVPPESSGIGIARELTAHSDLRGLRILLARADAASRDLPDALRAAGAEVHEVVAYHTVEAPRESAGPLAEVLADGDLAAIVAASGSAVRGLVALASDAGLNHRVLATTLISIGPPTSRVARDLGFTRVFEAERPSMEALATAIDAAALSPSSMPALVRRSR